VRVGAGRSVDRWFLLSTPQSKVFVHVNKLDSVETIVPYEYSR